MNDSQIEFATTNAGDTSLVPHENEMKKLMDRMAEAFQIPSETLNQIQQIEIAVYPIPAYGIRVTITPK